MNPSSSHIPNFGEYKFSKICRKTYVPNLSASRLRNVKVEDNSNTEVKKELNPSQEKRRPFRRKFLPGVETFAPVPINTANSRISIKSRPKMENSTNRSSCNSSMSSSQVVKKEIFDHVEPFKEIQTKPYSGKFGQISSASPENLPVPVPRPLLFSPHDSKKPLSLLMDLFDPNGEESPLFILKMPKSLPAVSNNPGNPLEGTSKINVKNKSSKCTIHNLPEGQIGILQIMKSGRLRLVLGECKFWLQRGLRINFKSQLAYVSANAETKTGEIINLGDIKDTINAVPDSVGTLAADEEL